MQEDRRNAAETDEDGGGGSEKSEINSMGNHRTLGERRCPAEKRRERWLFEQQIRII